MELEWGVLKVGEGKEREVGLVCKVRKKIKKGIDMGVQSPNGHNWPL